ncbi:MAG: radical SAM protein [Acidobacteria bacterium]|nr:radical SAM protein [Acidobacteriota bacterium]
MPHASHPGYAGADEFLAMQRLAQSNLVFSVTRRCPLHCDHCVTSSGPEVAGDTLTVADAARYAAELPALYDAGVRHLTFTGGEPVLALPGVAVLAAAAKRVGLATSIVTSGAWAVSPAATLKVLDRLAAIDHWDLGFDRYHQKELALSAFCALLRALQARRIAHSVRACVETPPSEEDLALLDELRAATGPDVPIYRQSVRRIGRAAEILRRVAPAAGPPALEPCLSSGPIVREDGSIGPCCSGLAYERRGCHPFEFGDARGNSLVSAREAWLRDPLLRLVRLVGFAYPLKWLAETGDPALQPALMPHKTCELCVQLWDREGRVGRYLSDRAARPEVVAQLDRLERELFS